jgi:prophage DNA circulation protein
MASTWEKGYLQGSFRGVPFFIRRHTYSGGRRNVEHQFPDRDDVVYEDLGRGRRIFNLTAYIIGDNYFEHREALVSALELGGEGKLVHPYRGGAIVVADPYELTETTDEGRVARFNLTFKEQAIEKLTKVAPNPQTQAFAAKQSLLDRILAAFAKAYDVVRQPVNALEDITATIDKGFEVINAAKKIANTQAEFRRAIQNLKGKAIALALNAEFLADSFSQIINFGTDTGSKFAFNATPDNSGDQVKEQYEITEFADEPATNTPREIAQDPDYPAFQIQQMIKGQSIASLVGLTTVQTFDNFTEAQEAQEKLFKLIDEFSQTDFVDDEIYESLQDCKAAINNDLQIRSISLPRIVKFELCETDNALRLSNEIYGNIDQEDDIVKRNKNVIHPGFISSAVPIEIKVSDG